MAISITPSPFGSVTVTLDGELGGVLSVSVLATSNSVLDMAIGTPGPAGEAGEPGAAGVGVPVGGTTGQVLAKIDGTNYNTEWVDAGAAGDFLPLSGGTMSGAILFDAVGGQNISKGSFDSGRGGYNGISLNCANLYELNWQSGYLKNIYNNAVAPINVESDIVNTTIPDNDNQGTKSTFNSNGLSAIFYNAGGAENTFITNYGHSSIDHTYFDNPQNFHLNQNGVYGIGDGEVSWGVTINGVTYPDSTIQVTAFPPSGGLVTEYITGTGTLVTFPEVGDRYLTSSTSTLTCDSGNGKTMTVGTGLSYSRQQDITVSYSNSIHMHGTVLTYDSVTGVMTFDSNTHSGSGTFSNWEVNVGGVAGAVLPVSGTAGQVLAKVNSVNFNTEWLSLGTMSTEPASAYLSTASAVSNYLTISSASSTYQTQAGMSAYLSTSAAASTYQTQAGMSAYLSTSAAASTYQTQSGMSAYLSTASASANFIGTSAYATTAQAQAGTSTTTVISPATLLDAKYFQGGKFINTNTYSTLTSGTGAVAGTISMNAQQVQAPTTAIGYASRYGAIANSSRGLGSVIDFTKRVIAGGRFQKNSNTTDSNSIFRFYLGKSNTVNDMSSSDRGIGFRVAGSGALQLTVANNTTLTTTTSSFTPTLNQAYDVVIVADAGTATMYVNGSSVATSTGASTASSSNNYIGVEAQNSAIIATPASFYIVSDIFAQVNS